jgi:cytochrome oxidase Cu insertion factor (SCO1/SenC/PrrC family)
LTGDKKVLKRLANSYGADFVVRKSDNDVYYVWHTNDKYLVGPGGQLIKTFPSSASANEIAGEIRRHLE